MQYYKIYIQSEADGAAMKETIADYGMYCMEFPFKVSGDIKSPAKRSWYDEDGDDEYVPDGSLKVEAYETTVKFGYKGARNSAPSAVRAFLSYLRSAGLMKIYCEYGSIGRRGVRLSKVADDAELIQDASGDLVVFKVTFKVNDPVTEVELKTGSDGNKSLAVEA